MRAGTGNQIVPAYSTGYALKLSGRPVLERRNPPAAGTTWRLTVNDRAIAEGLVPLQAATRILRAWAGRSCIQFQHGNDRNARPDQSQLRSVDGSTGRRSVSRCSPTRRGWTERDNLVQCIAAGVPATTVAPAIQEREDHLRRLDARLRIPTVTKRDQDRLRSALEQRANDWKRELRKEPRVARLVLRRLVGPIVLHDESERPDFVKWEAEPTTGLLDGLAAPTLLVASPPGLAPDAVLRTLQPVFEGEARRRAA